jgi:hydrogenase maturation protease
VVVDAMVAGREAGTIYRHPLEELEPNPIIGSMHGFDLPRVMTLVRRTDHPHVVVVGVEPQRIEWSLELSPPVAAAVPAVIEVVLDEVASLGLADRRKSA